MCAADVLVRAETSKLVIFAEAGEFDRARVLVDGVYGKPRRLRARDKIIGIGGRANIVVGLFAF